MKYLLHFMIKLGLSNYLAKQLQQPNGYFGSRLIGRMMNKGNAELEQLSLQSAAVSSTHHILEIGFGNGQLLEQLCAIVTEGKVYGADISQDLITQVSKKFKSQIDKGEVELHLSGVSKLQFENNSFDTIISNNTLYFWPEPEKDARELLRVLKPNGKLVLGFRTADDMKNYPFVTQNLHIFKNHYSEEQAKKLLAEAGFSSITTHEKKGELATSHVAIAVK